MKRAETDPEQTMLIDEGPKTLKDAINSSYEYSDVAHQSQAAACPDRSTPPPFSSVPECCGWMRVKRDALPELENPVWKKVDEQFDQH